MKLLIVPPCFFNFCLVKLDKSSHFCVKPRAWQSLTNFTGFIFEQTSLSTRLLSMRFHFCYFPLSSSFLSASWLRVFRQSEPAWQTWWIPFLPGSTVGGSEESQCPRPSGSFPGCSRLYGKWRTLWNSTCVHTRSKYQRQKERKKRMILKYGNGGCKRAHSQRAMAEKWKLYVQMGKAVFEPGEGEGEGEGEERRWRWWRRKSTLQGKQVKTDKERRDRGAEQRQMETKKHQEDLLESSPVLPSSWSVQSGPAACEPDNQYSWNTIPVPWRHHCQGTRPLDHTSWQQHCWVHLRNTRSRMKQIGFIGVHRRYCLGDDTATSYWSVRCVVCPCYGNLPLFLCSADKTGPEI